MGSLIGVAIIARYVPRKQTDLAPPSLIFIACRTLCLIGRTISEKRGEILFVVTDVN